MLNSNALHSNARAWVRNRAYDCRRSGCTANFRQIVKLLCVMGLGRFRKYYLEDYIFWQYPDSPTRSRTTVPENNCSREQLFSRTTVRVNSCSREQLLPDHMTNHEML